MNVKIHSELQPTEYLQHLRSNLSPWYAFGDERLTGFVLGKFFSVVYHSGYEWNRRATNEKNRAIGFVRADGPGTKVVCIRLKGLLNPLSLILMTLAVYGFGWLYWYLSDAASSGVGMAEWNQANLLLGVAFAVIFGIVTAIQAAATERGAWGAKALTAILKHPEAPWQNIE